MNNNGIKYGLIFAGSSIILNLIAYFTDVKSLMSLTGWRSIVGIILMIGFMYLAAKKTRDQKGGFIPFGEAFVPSFVTFAIGGIFGTGFIYLLINYSDPSVQEIINQSLEDLNRNALEMAGLKEDQVLEVLEKMKEDDPFSISRAIVGFFSNLLTMGLPISAIIAAIVKKKNPVLQP